MQPVCWSGAVGDASQVGFCFCWWLNYLTLKTLKTYITKDETPNETNIGFFLIQKPLEPVKVFFLATSDLSNYFNGGP